MRDGLPLCLRRGGVLLGVPGIVASVAMLMMSVVQISGSAAEPTTGTITGRVIYQSDPKHPWRYARYYVKSRRTGELAEAVVGLTDNRLRKQAPESKPATVAMDQKDFRFIPETVVVRAGDSVRFGNSDGVVHNVRTADGRQPFNVNIPPGRTHTEAFEKSGGIRKPIGLGCVFHSSMRGWIFVFDHPWAMVTGQDGKFVFENVPPGRHDLALRHPAGNLEWSGTVEVVAGKTARVEIVLSPENLAGE